MYYSYDYCFTNNKKKQKQKIEFSHILQKYGRWNYFYSKVKTISKISEPQFFCWKHDNRRN